MKADDLVLSPFKEIETIMKCALPPSSFEYPLDSVKQQLNDLLFRYNYDIQAVPICYSQIIFPKGKEFGRIMGEQPLVHVDIKTKLVIFQPEIGKNIFARITKVS
jgi:hypothetical protein